MLYRLQVDINGNIVGYEIALDLTETMLESVDGYQIIELDLDLNASEKKQLHHATVQNGELDFSTVESSINDERRRVIPTLIKNTRSKLLAATDFMLSVDYPLSELQKKELANYRQSLRDLPNSLDLTNYINFEDIPFPEKPIWIEEDSLGQLKILLDQREYIPNVLTARQARLALQHIDKLADVETSILSLPEAQRNVAEIEWEYSTEVKRHHQFIDMLAPALGLTDEDVDNLFILGASL